MSRPLYLFTTLASAWQLPGLIPKNYEKGMNLDIMVG